MASNPSERPPPTLPSIAKEVEAVQHEQRKAFKEIAQQLARLRANLVAAREDPSPESLASLAATTKNSNAPTVLAKRHQNYHAKLSQLSRSLSEFQSITEGDITKAIRQHILPKRPETTEQNRDFSRYMRKIIAVHLLQTGHFGAFETFLKEVEAKDGITGLVPEHYLPAYQESQRIKSGREVDEAARWLKENRSKGKAAAMRREIFDDLQRDMILENVAQIISSGTDAADILEYIRKNFDTEHPVSLSSDEQQKRLQACLLALAYPTTERGARLAVAAGLHSDALKRFWTLFFRGTWPAHIYSPLKKDTPSSIASLARDSIELSSATPAPKRFRLWSPEPLYGYAQTGTYTVSIPKSSVIPNDIECTIRTPEVDIYDPLSLHCWDDEPSLPPPVSAVTQADPRFELGGEFSMPQQHHQTLRRSSPTPRLPRARRQYVSPSAPRPTAIHLHDANFVMRILTENARHVEHVRSGTPTEDLEVDATDNDVVPPQPVLSQPSEGDTPGVPRESPLYLLLASGRVAVRQLLEVQSVVERHEMLGVPCESLPVEFDLPERFTPHSVFTCPVSRKMTTTSDEGNRRDFPTMLVVRIKNGPVEGIVYRKNLMAAQPRPRDVAAFYGIPFAAPPVGNLRFRPPQPLNETWSEPRLMNKTGFSCADREDCLYLDLFAPNDAINSNASLPVFLWVHGGGFAFGVPENGTALASVHNIIVVSIRYRLGHFGFFASPASLSQEGTTGNWGTLDQQFAMKWIQANIGAFGGDHDKVTLAGQSAGGFSVMWHLVAPGSAGLFHRAIMESGTAETPIFFQSPNDSFSYHSWVATRLCGCNSSDDLECLRKVNASALRLSGQWSTNGTLRATLGPPWASILFPIHPVGPVIDGSTLPDVPLALVQKGDFNKVPLIVGGNRDEGTAYAWYLPRFIQGAPPSPTADFFNR
ncbi:hypothetical protein FOL47_008663, partial [Perkinsus chesapeaki]